ncbi:hypothetical protein MKZ38_006337 [Zalerion maritima]|uniref:Probable beta-glucosidase btgE n=1 Tax=Zalerion maritima TaxID=339359 RepID=A0AAD5RVK5_9PEZI|nr:hypothetical protein MKZ38_006337 [Zalerion maritima]
MKGTIIAAAAAALSGVEAAQLHHRHGHPMLAKKHAYGTGTGYEDECVCTTVVETSYGEPSLVGVSEYEHPAETTVIEEVAVIPTAAVETCPTPGTYTFPATTVTLTETTVVCGATSTSVSPGTHTIGGVTTVVETATTVVCPYATTSTDDSGVVTSIIETTTYVCPSAGTYTIAPVTTECVEETVIVVPIVESYTPGTYTRPEVVTTITETDVVVVCPYTVSPVPEAETTEAAEVPITTTEEEEAPATTTAAEEYQETTTEVEAAATSAATSGGSSSLGSGNDHWAMTYTPYTDDSLCKSQGQIDDDIAAIAGAGFTAVRVYSTDCSTLPYIGGACADNGLKIILGIFINGDGCSNSNPTVPEQISAIAEWAQWDMVDAIVVGNEAIYNGYCTASEIADLVSTCKSEFSGYSGPYTTAETLNIWELDSTSSVLCDALDVIGANIHPYFNAGVTASTAGTFVAGQLDIIDSICPGKTGINLECGWPSAGSCIGSACPGSDAQATAISDIREKAGDRTCFFSFTNDMWKDAGSCGCEQSWGCGSLF